MRTAVLLVALAGCGVPSGGVDAPGWYVPTGAEPRCPGVGSVSCSDGVPGCLDEAGEASDATECVADPVTGRVRPVCWEGGRPACLRVFE